MITVLHAWQDAVINFLRVSKMSFQRYFYFKKKPLQFEFVNNGGAHLTKMTTLATSKPKIDDVNYKHLYHKIREHNRKLVVKMNKARRGAGFWKSQHAELMNAIWGWRASDPVSRETVWVKHPLLSITK